MAQSTKRSAANPYRTGGPSRYLQTRGGTSSIPVTGIRTGAKVSVGGGGKGGAPAAKGASAEAPKVPTGVEPGEPSAPEYDPIIDAETMSPPVDPNRQEAILNQARAPRFAIGNPNVGNIDLGSLLSAKPTEGFDPNAPVGGANVPFQETKGVGGFFRRMFGDTANEQNIAAQQAQAADWKAADVEAQKEERLLNRMREADKPTQARFEATQKAAEIAEANRVAAENKRLELEGQRLGLTKQQIEDARLDRVARLQAEKEDRDIRIENMRTQNAINDAEFGLRSRVAGRRNTQVIPGKDGGYSIFDIDKGEPIGSYSPGGLGMVRKDPNDPNSPMIPGTTPGGWEPYVPPVTVPKDLPDSPQVDRTTGAAPGGPRKDTMGGKLPPPEVTPMRAAAPSPEADASLLGRFKTAMPSLSFAQPSGRGYQVAPLTEGDVAQQAMGQIAYPLRAAVGQQVKGQYTNPEEVAMSMEYPMPASRFRRPSAKEQAEALAAGDLIRKMYAE
jgi:hypothetical protein